MLVRRFCAPLLCAASVRRFCAPLLCAASVLIASSTTLSVHAQTTPPAVPPRYFTTVFKTTRPLALDIACLAVYDTRPKDGDVSAGVRGSDGCFAAGITQDLLDTLYNFGIEEADVRPFYGQIALATVPQSVRDGGPDALEAFITSILAANDHIFVSPVFTNEDSGGIFIPTRDVFVEFHPDAPDADKQAVLAALHADTVTRRDDLTRLGQADDTLSEEFSGPAVLNDPNEPVAVAPPDDPSPQTVPSPSVSDALNGVQHLQMQSHSGLDILNAMNAASQAECVQFAEANHVMQAQPCSSGDYISGWVEPQNQFWWNMWGLRNGSYPYYTPQPNLNAQVGWGQTMGISNVVIAILDTGVSRAHSSLYWQTLPGYSCQTGVVSANGGEPSHRDVYPWNNDSARNYNAHNQHGTTVAGVISGSGYGVGIAPGCRTISIRVVWDDPKSTISMTDSYSVAVGIALAEKIGARITNNSTSYLEPNNSYLISLAYERTRGRGMIHFASAGNQNLSNIQYPSNLRSVYSVGAIAPSYNNTARRWNDGDGPEQASCYGDGLSFMAPGKSIFTPVYYWFWSVWNLVFFEQEDSIGWTTVNGTSFSAPYMAGLAGLILSVNPALNADDVWQIMRGSAAFVNASSPKAVTRGIYNTEYGWGVPNVSNAMRDAARPRTVAIASDSQGNTRLLWQGNSSIPGERSGARLCITTNRPDNTTLREVWVRDKIAWDNIHHLSMFKDCAVKGYTVDSNWNDRILLTREDGSVGILLVNKDTGVIINEQWYAMWGDWAGYRGVAIASSSSGSTWVLLAKNDDGYRMLSFDGNGSWNNTRYCAGFSGVPLDLAITPNGEPLVLLTDSANAGGSAWVTKHTINGAPIQRLFTTSAIDVKTADTSANDINPPGLTENVIPRQYVPCAIQCSKSGNTVYLLFNGLDGRVMVQTYPSGYSSPLSSATRLTNPIRHKFGANQDIQPAHYYPSPYFTSRGFAVDTNGCTNLLWNLPDAVAAIWQITGQTVPTSEGSPVYNATGNRYHLTGRYLYSPSYPPY